jgi:hypothetical protein
VGLDLRIQPCSVLFDLNNATLFATIIYVYIETKAILEYENDCFRELPGEFTKMFQCRPDGDDRHLIGQTVTRDHLTRSLEFGERSFLRQCPWFKR